MAITYTDNGGGAPNGSDLEFTFTFPVLQTEDVKVALNNVVQATTKYAVDTASNPTKITFNNTSVDTNVQESTGAPKSGVTVRVFRQTQVGKSTGDDDPKAVYAAGSSIRAVDLNANTEQALYAIHELQDQPLTDQDIEDGTITSAKIQDNTIANVDVSPTAAIDGTKITPNFGSQNISTTGTINNLTTTELAILDGATVSTNELNLLDGVTATTSELNLLDGVTATTTELNLLDGVTATTTELNLLDGVTATTSELNTLDGVTATTAEINYVDGVTSNVQTQLDAKQPLDDQLTTLADMQAGTAAKLADATALTSDIVDLNQLDGMEKQFTITNSDTKFPTSGAVVDYVSGQLDDIGGFEAIANELSFPNTQPGVGVAISIADAAGIVVDSSGSSTTGRTLAGSTVTINNIPSNFYSSTVNTGVRFIVISTGSGQVYNYHKATLAESDLVNLSGDINDFNERYRVGSTNPNTSLDNGDLFFNTDTGKMLVYNGTNAAWEEVQSIGNFYISTLSPAFDGTTQNFTLTNAPTNVQQIILSINGVVQKPNAGSTTPSEGFALDGSTVKLSAAPAASDNYFAIVMGSTVNIGTPSNNTVDEDILQNLSVSTGKIQNNAVTLGKLEQGTALNNGKFLRANNGADPTFETINQFVANNVIGLYDQDSTPNQRVLASTEGVTIQGTSAAVSKLMFRDRTTANFLKFKPVDTLANNVEFTLPSADGNTGEFLTTDGNGALSFAQASSPEVYGFNTSGSQLQVTTTNSGADNIDATTYASFDDVVFAATGFTFSLDSTTGQLVATI